MGSTGYMNMTADQAKASELRGCTTIAKSGNWVIGRNHTGHLFAVHFQGKRYGDEYVVKTVEVSMGPYEVPSEAFFRRWERLTDAEDGYVVGEYEAQWRERCEAKYAAKRTASMILEGEAFTVKTPYSYGSGIGEVSSFTLLDRRRRIARTPNGDRVRLPRGWESNVAN